MQYLAMLQSGLEAVQRYSQHIEASRNAAIERLRHRIRRDEVGRAHWLQMAQSGQGPVSPAYSPGDMVIPLTAHMPEHAGKTARVVQVVQNQPFYVLDFGGGHPHRWYAEDELRPAPTGASPGQ